MAADEALTNSRFDDFRREPDVFAAMVAQADRGLDRSLDTSRSDLLMEIMAESGRHDGIAGLVQASDRRLREQLIELMARVDEARGQPVGADAARCRAARAELVIALFDGLRVRAIRHPGIDRDAVLHLMRPVLARILEGA